jgi:hypothetical protein
MRTTTASSKVSGYADADITTRRPRPAKGGEKEKTMSTITIWKREDSNTTPRGFGNPPTYYIDEPRTSDAEMIWAEPIKITLPDGWSVGVNAYGERIVFDETGTKADIIDHNGHPAVIVDAVAIGTDRYPTHCIWRMLEADGSTDSKNKNKAITANGGEEENTMSQQSKFDEMFRRPPTPD